MDTIIIIAIVAAGVLAIPLMWYVHRGLERCYILFGRRFCKKRGLTVSEARCGPEFEDSGVKAEYPIVEFECVTAEGVRQLVRLRVWIFGVKKVLSIEDFHEEEEVSQQVRKVSSETAVSDKPSTRTFWRQTRMTIRKHYHWPLVPLVVMLIAFIVSLPLGSCQLSRWHYLFQTYIYPKDDLRYPPYRYEGVWTTYYPNGRKWAAWRWEWGRTLHGSGEAYYDNGQLMSRQTWHHGKREGIDGWWWRNGTIGCEIPYHNGIEQPGARYWNEEGQPVTEEEFVTEVQRRNTETWGRNASKKTTNH